MKNHWTNIKQELKVKIKEVIDSGLVYEKADDFSLNPLSIFRRLSLFQYKVIWIVSDMNHFRDFDDQNEAIEFYITLDRAMLSSW